jgi:RNA polymerase sigma factor (sigma-70 family)
MGAELDSATLRACRRGDPAAFRALVACYQDRVYALCVALAGSDGEDLAQETFVRVHGAIGRFDPDGPASLLGWILTIARRLCVDRARAHSRQTALTLDLAVRAHRAPLRGRIVVRLHVVKRGDKGVVDAAEILRQGTSLNEPPDEQCILEAVGHAELPAPARSTQTITYPFVLDPPDDDMELLQPRF